MERVETLSKKLQEQLIQNASIDQLLLTVQMLQSELQHLKSSEPAVPAAIAAAIDIPVQFEEKPAPVKEQETIAAPEEKL